MVSGIANRHPEPEGSVLSRQNERGRAFYAILEGKVQISRQSPRGALTVRVAGPGECLPLAAVLGMGLLITSAYAMTDLLVAEIPTAEFHALCRQHPEIGFHVYQAIADILAERYRITLGRLVETLLGSPAPEPQFFANM